MRDILRQGELAFFALNRVCFHERLPYTPVLAGEDQAKYCAAFIRSKTRPRILLNVPFLREKPLYHLVNTVFHEMIHAFCYLNSIDDVQDGQHTEQFKHCVERFGGICEQTSAGWEKAYLPDGTGTMSIVIEYMEYIERMEKQSKGE